MEWNDGTYDLIKKLFDVMDISKTGLVPLVIMNSELKDIMSYTFKKIKSLRYGDISSPDFAIHFEKYDRLCDDQFTFEGGL